MCFILNTYNTVAKSSISTSTSISTQLCKKNISQKMLIGTREQANSLFGKLFLRHSTYTAKPSKLRSLDLKK